MALLEETARERLHADQQVLDLEMPTAGRAEAGSMSGAAVVESTSAVILWNALGVTRTGGWVLVLSGDRRVLLHRRLEGQ